MPGKITYALLHREADIYRSQGLPRESLRVYENLLESAPDLPAKTQAAIAETFLQVTIIAGGSLRAASASFPTGTREATR